MQKVGLIKLDHLDGKSPVNVRTVKTRSIWIGNQLGLVWQEEHQSLQLLKISLYLPQSQKTYSVLLKLKRETPEEENIVTHKNQNLLSKGSYRDTNESEKTKLTEGNLEILRKSYEVNEQEE